MQSFSNLVIGEKRVLAVGLKRLLGTTDVLVDGDVVVTAENYEFSNPTDASPSDILDGLAQVNDTPVTIKGVVVPAGQAILQAIDVSALKAVVNCTYCLRYNSTIDGEEIIEPVLVTVTKYGAP